MYAPELGPSRFIAAPAVTSSVWSGVSVVAPVDPLDPLALVAPPGPLPLAPVAPGGAVPPVAAPTLAADPSTAAKHTATSFAEAPKDTRTEDRRRVGLEAAVCLEAPRAPPLQTLTHRHSGRRVSGQMLLG
jgi:hypothetical protein